MPVFSIGRTTIIIVYVGKESCPKCDLNEIGINYLNHTCLVLPAIFFVYLYNENVRGVPDVGR